MSMPTSYALFPARSRFVRQARLLFTGLTFFAAPAASLRAQSTFVQVDIGAAANNTSNNKQVHTPGPAPISVQAAEDFTAVGSNTAASASASIQPGALHAVAAAQSDRVFAPNAVFLNTAHAMAQADLLIDDLVFTNTSGAASVNTALFFTLDGSYTTGLGLAPQSYAENDLQVAITDSFTFSGGISDFISPQTRTGSITGDLAEFLPDGVINLYHTHYNTVHANTPLSLLIQLEVSAGTGGDGVASTDFGNTLKFIEGQPVFDLPTGWTANSAEGNIINNRYLAPTVVPEPGLSALLLSLSLIVLPFLVRRQASTGRSLPS